MNHQTIYALASGGGRAGIAVIRVSGPGAGGALRALTAIDLPPPRRTALVSFRHPIGGALLDQGLCIWFKEPHSFTGEDIAELHVHGGRAVVSSVLSALGDCEGLRLAEPGEFARRAFENHKLDLTAVEGLADLINAETEAQQRLALRQMQGELCQLYEAWRTKLMAISVQVEASIDFAGEELPEGLEAMAAAGVNELICEISNHLHDGRRGEILRHGLQVAIIGPPNAGKSSFLNLLTRRNTAIVSEIPGTTRDVIECRLDIGGYPVVVVDTAGLCEGADKIEKEGIRRARERALAAELKIAIFDVAKGLDPYTFELIDEQTLVIANKIDLGRSLSPAPIKGHLPCFVSLLTREGVEEMLKRLADEVISRAHLSSSPLLTQARHREALQECCRALRRFGGESGLQACALELAAEELRLAVRALGRITGRVDVDDILGGIFKEFCIGK